MNTIIATICETTVSWHSSFSDERGGLACALEMQESGSKNP